ncbi:transposase [Pseudanabaena galeata UHCC 0370]|uniref:Transposase n=1 Tax=Pseudanabaena galeata UHCC 0370 TaxID=3110310 RepID=A0ABU5TJR8_9CYAN|nr:transposase [Pseudanabaena galeata]MEA5478514.1 transposase [Pseudanabaena galeata UHCC 0370]
MIINDKGELLAFKLTPANIDDRQPVPEMAQDLFGQLFGDRSYISQKLFEKLYEQGLQLITKRKKKERKTVWSS